MIEYIIVGAAGMAAAYRMALAICNTGAPGTRRAKLVQLLGGGGGGGPVPVKPN
jgi:hypothetical protein